ncbi:DUF4097 family beta strand repeat-containing protein [Nonomuraea soli]|uniref:Adhesin domain-containing protein n=1 Tax=Nonomuraea soli TaxID=1032476 RepID=A0A7W0CN59_9ACTN|nr:DUF4097 family beta strand repeat-containing protein [Nonomuraea soli]MBA2894274.1 hypothetical protein [Nonomuraea soli]
MKAFWLLVGSLCTVFAVGVATAGMFAGFADARAPSETVSWSESFDRTSLKIDASRGDIELTIERGPAGQIFVEKSLQWWEAKPETGEEWDRRSLKLSSNCEDGRVAATNCLVHYLVRVPADTDIEAVTGSGALHVSRLRGNLTLTSENGTIDMAEIWSPQVLARSDRGHIFSFGMLSDSVDAESVTGSVRLSFDKAPGQVRAAVQTGDEIEIRVPEGTAYNVAVEAVHDFIGVMRSAEAAHTMTLSNPHGTVKVCCS